MKLPNRESAIRKSVQHRQAVKKKWDRHCKYASDDEVRQAIEAGDSLEFTTKSKYSPQENGDNWIRLLDEGVVVDGGDWVFAVIAKGVLKRFYEELPDSFEGYIDKDHIPSLFLGRYTKDELKLVELSDDRYALDVNIKLDKSLYAVQDLIKENQHNAVSVEMFTKADEYVKVSKITGMSEKEVKEKYGWDYLVPIISDLAIPGFALCRAPKNANSYKDGLLDKASVSEREEMTKEKKAELEKANLEAESSNAEENTAPAENEAEGDVVTDEPTEAPDTASGGNPDVNAEESGTEGEAAEGDTESESDEAVADGITDEQFEQLKSAIAELKASIVEKDAKIAELGAQLAEKKESAKSANMSKSDRIAELLSFATLTEPSEGEGGSAGQTTSKLSEAEQVEDFYRAAFKQ